MSVLGGVFVGLGANLGDPQLQVRRAFDELESLPDTRVESTSTIYRTPAWGDVTQPDYANAVAELRTPLDPGALVGELLALERRLGRERGDTKWAPRTIDLDLLVYRDRIVHEPGCAVPHPHLAERAFVLVPLAEIAPQLVIPGLGRVKDLLAKVDATRVVRWRPRTATRELAALPKRDQ